VKQIVPIFFVLGVGSVAAYAQQPAPVELEHPKAANAGQGQSLEGLDAYIRNAMAEWQIPGLAIAVVKDDQVVFLKTYGVREVGKEAPVDEETVFPLASMTKAFTAAAVGVLVDEGTLSWDDPVIKHLPGFQLPDPWVTRHVTLRDLLAHRVGGDLGRPLWILELATTLDSDELLRRLRHLQPGEPRFRSRWAYRNTGFAVAGEVIEAVSGMSWAEFVQARLLRPLGMTSATTSAVELWDPDDLLACWFCDLPARTVSYEDARVENIVMPHVLAGGNPRSVPWHGRGSAPSGSINANIQDVAKWIRLQLAEGLYEGERFLSAAVVEEMHAPQIPIRRDVYPLGPGSGHFWAYGLGWFLTDYGARKVVLHGGGDHSFIAMMPEEKLGVAVLTNLRGDAGSRANNLRVALPFWIFDTYLGAPQRDWSADFLAKAQADRIRLQESVERQEAQQERGTRLSLPLERYVGAYSHAGLGEVRVAHDGDRLVLQFPGGGGGDLEHWGQYGFFMLTWKGNHGIQDFVTFAIDPRGRVEELRIRIPNAPTGHAVFRRVAGDSPNE